MKIIKQSVLIITGILSFSILMIVLTGTMAYTEGQLEYGREVYTNNCLSCHGKDGKDGFAPALHNILEKYPSEKELLSYISKNMPIGMAGELSTEEYEAVVNYISSLHKSKEEKTKEPEAPKEEAKEPEAPKEEAKEPEAPKEEVKKEPKQEANTEIKEEPKTNSTNETEKVSNEQSSPDTNTEKVAEEQSNPDTESENLESQESSESIEVNTIPSKTENKEEDNQAPYVENNNQAIAEIGVTKSKSSSNVYLWIILFIVISIGGGIFFRQKLKNQKSTK